MAPQFILVPFNKERDLKINVEVKRDKDLLILSYTPTIENIFTPPSSKGPQRRDKLWQTTCFELFIKDKKSDAYIEFNFSPSGDWNCYKFKTYRELEGEQAIESPPLISKTGRTFYVELDTRDINIFDDYEVNVTAVIESQKEIFYLASSHPEKRPDFHDGRFFIDKKF